MDEAEREEPEQPVWIFEDACRHALACCAALPAVKLGELTAAVRPPAGRKTACPGRQKATSPS